jgi:hypothetical protein
MLVSGGNMTSKLIIAASLVLASRAFAQDAAPGNAPPPVATATATATPADEWPESTVDQSYVVRKGKIAAYGSFEVDHLSLTFFGTTVSETAEGFHVGGAFGVVDHLQLGVEYGFPIAADNMAINKERFLGPLALFASYAFLDTEKLHAAATFDFQAQLCGTTDMNGNCAITSALHAGVHLRFNITPMIAVFTGAPFGPAPGGQVIIQLTNPNEVLLTLPIGIAIQPTKQLFLYAEPTLMGLFIANKPSTSDQAAFYFSDQFGAPTVFGAWYAVTKQLHAGVTFADDLKHAGDLYAIQFGARWYQ